MLEQEPIAPREREPGRLQLTDNRASAVGGVVYDNAIPASGGLDIKFDQYQYGTSSGGADGIGFFLTDGSVPLTAAGPAGGGLGYAQTTTAAGVAGGYLGVGLDAFGNFSSPTEGAARAAPPRSPASASARTRSRCADPARASRATAT